MEMIWIWLTGVVTGVLIMALVWSTLVKKMAAESLECVRRQYFGAPVTADVADRAQIALLASQDLQVMLDFIIAAMIDAGGKKILDACSSNQGYGPAIAEAGGMIKGAEAIATCIENLKSGDMQKEIAEEEQKRLRS